MFYHFISQTIFNRCAELWVLYKYQKIVTERMICHNFEKNMGQVLHCNTSFNSRLNRKCKVQLMISLSKDRDIQLLQHPLIFILWLSNKLLWGLVAAAEICWKISEILQATGIVNTSGPFWGWLNHWTSRSDVFWFWISCLLPSCRDLCFWRLQKQVLDFLLIMYDLSTT